MAATLAFALSISISLASSTSPAHASSNSEVLHSIRSMRVKNTAAACRNCAGSNNLSYHGGAGGVGVETGADKVYLIYWGSQWNNNDPSHEAAIQQSFFNNVGGSSWNDSVKQYCEGVALGTTSCGSYGTHATHPKNVLAGL